MATFLAGLSLVLVFFFFFGALLALLSPVALLHQVFFCFQFLSSFLQCTGMAPGPASTDATSGRPEKEILPN